MGWSWNIYWMIQVIIYIWIRISCLVIKFYPKLCLIGRALLPIYTFSHRCLLVEETKKEENEVSSELARLLPEYSQYIVLCYFPMHIMI